MNLGAHPFCSHAGGRRRFLSASATTLRNASIVSGCRAARALAAFATAPPLPARLGPLPIVLRNRIGGGSNHRKSNVYASRSAAWRPIQRVWRAALRSVGLCPAEDCGRPFSYANMLMRCGRAKVHATGRSRSVEGCRDAGAGIRPQRPRRGLARYLPETALRATSRRLTTQLPRSASDLRGRAGTRGVAWQLELPEHRWHARDQTMASEFRQLVVAQGALELSTHSCGGGRWPCARCQ
jgi:hypothetical protein